MQRDSGQREAYDGEYDVIAATSFFRGRLRAAGLGPAKIREPADSEIGLEMDL